jgi:Tfp pilus assembly protein PilZ
MSLQSELRRHVRVDCERRAWCEHRDWTLYLPIANLSLGGLFVHTSTPFATGERLRVCLTDRDPLLMMEVEVVWSSSRGRTVGIGCRIVAFLQGADAYADLVEQLQPGGR